MRSSIPPRTSGALAHLCAACRRRATSSNPRTFAAINAPTLPLRKQSQPPGRRWLSSTRAPWAQQPASDIPPSSVSGEGRPSPPSYYALFPSTLSDGPPPNGPFHIDVRTLRREFLRLQASSHPDFHAHANADPAARRRAEGASALINEAFRTLSNPLLRAQYLLREQYGIDMAGDEAGSITRPEGDVLEAVLEAREQIEEAEREEELLGLREENEQRILQAEEVIGEAFRSGDLEALKREVVRLRYWVNIRESIDNWEMGKPVVLEH
ncbi:hypothetical protein DL546_007160 [Coniochaeta pulveracea]|uniref:Co-chaperone HscB C-terminal oligomerisation domain-containing protein n=1 Tax=Coniochaeta pulveracea TaxID=177199 RepID=A0A420YFJ6_9PEZI|nr:hypothetical protein DL546_007160 [Coniochaeta pulveracea]